MIASSFSFDLCGMNGQGNNLVVQSTTAPSELKEEKKRQWKKNNNQQTCFREGALKRQHSQKAVSKKSKKQTLPACLYPSIEKL